MEDFIEDQIKRNISNRVFIEKSMGKDISDESCLDMLEKAGTKAQLGEVRTWGGKEYIKTPKGWRPKPKGFKADTTKKEEPKKDSRGNSSLVDEINRKLREGFSSVKDDMKEDVKKIEAQANKKSKFVPLFGGNEGRIIDTKPNGDLIVEYRRKGEKNWTDTVKVGSDDYKNLTDSWGRKDNKHFKFEDKGGGKFELEIPGKGGAQISEGDGKFEVKVWDENYKYITDDSKRHVFDSKSEAEDFARILLDKK